jgi:hypothetical protein
MTWEQAKPDRRASVRFPITLDLRYSSSPRRVPAEACSGQLIDLSSSGARFAAPGHLEARSACAAEFPLTDGPVLFMPPEVAGPIESPGINVRVFHRHPHLDPPAWFADWMGNGAN